MNSKDIIQSEFQEGIKFFLFNFLDVQLDQLHQTPPTLKPNYHDVKIIWMLKLNHLDGKIIWMLKPNYLDVQLDQSRRRPRLKPV